MKSRKRRVVILVENAEDVQTISAAVAIAMPQGAHVIVTNCEDDLRRTLCEVADAVVISTRLVLDDGQSLPALVKVMDGKDRVLFIHYHGLLPSAIHPAFSISWFPFPDDDCVDATILRGQCQVEDHEILARVVAAIGPETTLECLSAEFPELRRCEHARRAFTPANN